MTPAWLNAVFSPRMGGIPPANMDISIEGQRLAYLSPEIEAKKNIDQLKEYAGWFLHLEPSFIDQSPFALR